MVGRRWRGSHNGSAWKRVRVWGFLFIYWVWWWVVTRERGVWDWESLREFREWVWESFFFFHNQIWSDSYSFQEGPMHIDSGLAQLSGTCQWDDGFWILRLIFFLLVFKERISYFRIWLKTIARCMNRIKIISLRDQQY